jgi:hypothetical protein
MTRLEEKRLAFEFSDEWRVFKFDEHHDYRKGIEKIDNAKAVDFLGIFEDSTLYFVEVKDFRGYRIENKARLSNMELAIELAQKVKDSLACIVGSFHSSSEPKYWQPYVTLLCRKNSQIKIVLWLEDELPKHPEARQKVMASTRTKVFKQKLSWFTTHVLVCGSSRQDLPGVQVVNLSRI